MQFMKKSIEGILDGRKTQTRRLVKEDDRRIADHPASAVYIVEPNSKKKFRFKYQVGKDYAVQAGQGKPGLWHCPKCRTFFPADESMKRLFKNNKDCFSCIGGKVKPFRIVITGIRKERLLDISEEDVKKEGFDFLAEFTLHFCEFNKIPATRFINERRFFGFGPEKIKKLIVNGKNWNPEVWVLEFKVKE